MTTTHEKSGRQMWRAACLGAGVAVVALAGCRGERSDKPPRQFFPDMDDSPKWKPQGESHFFADGRTMRRPVPGVVPFGLSADADAPDRARYLKEDRAFYFGQSEAEDADGRPIPVTYMPVEVTPALIARGQDRYTIYCSVCHGHFGDGKGQVGVRWSYVLPNFHDAKYVERDQPTGSDGHIFQIIRNGLIDQTGAVKMPSYAHAVSEHDAWAIVSYIRALQKAQTRKPAPPPPPGDGAAPASPGASRGAPHGEDRS